MRRDASGVEVRYERAGRVVARVHVPGAPFELAVPDAVSVQNDRAQAVIRLVESTDAFRECVGILSIPYLGPSGPGVAVLDVPPPSPFSRSDIAVMWAARNELDIPRRVARGANAAWSRIRLTRSDGIDLVALARAIGEANRLLQAWPRRDTTQLTWLPVARAGGRLRVRVTERHSRIFEQHGDRTVPRLSARSVGGVEDHTLRSLSVVSGLVARRIRQAPLRVGDQDVRREVARLFDRVAERARPTRTVLDGPAASWPQSFRGAYRALQAALSELEVLGVGDQRAPLSEVWELYEVWALQRVVAGLSSTWGVPTAPTGGLLSWRWVAAGVDVEVRYQTTVPAWPLEVDVSGTALTAIVGELRPDILLTVGRGANARYAILDPKKRAAPMKQDDVTAQASKYLWGVRAVRSGEIAPEVLLHSVTLLAPRGGPSAVHASGRVRVVSAAPSVGSDQLDERMSELVTALSRVEDRAAAEPDAI
ncbi:hypothetical protein [Cellulomonas endometrii]|uniref:hypothetical protein n=1 Tax=Cellulomonas endometrii TaxID=3036301 RepID=UPI0024AD8375|nr:hypothetical protein [Cellulomonas endometrii]